MGASKLLVGIGLLLLFCNVTPDASAQVASATKCNIEFAVSSLRLGLPATARKFNVSDGSSAEGGYWLVAQVKGGIRGQRIDFGETGREQLDFFITPKNEFAVARNKTQYSSPIDPKRPVTVSALDREFFAGCDDYAMLRVGRASGTVDEKYRREFESLRSLVLANPLSKNR